MKTILFFYQDTLLNRSVCDAYITSESDVDSLIDWRKKCLSTDLERGYYAGLSITIVDKLDVTMRSL